MSEDDSELGRLRQRVSSLEMLMTRVMKWLDVSVSGQEAAALCDAMEELLAKKHLNEREH